MSKFAASQSEARGWFVCPPKNWRCNPSTTCCGPAIVHDYPSPNCFEHCTCGSGRSDVDEHVGTMSVILETWQDNGCTVQSLKGREPWQRDVMVRLVSSFHLVSCCRCIFISEFSLLAPPSVSQMSPTWAFKHTTILVFISVAFFLSPLWTPRSMQNSLIVFLTTPPPLRTIDTVEKLEKLAKKYLLKVVNEGTLSGAQLSTTGQTQRFFNHVQAAQTSSANANPFRRSQSMTSCAGHGYHLCRVFGSDRLVGCLFCKIVIGL